MVIFEPRMPVSSPFPPAARYIKVLFSWNYSNNALPLLYHFLYLTI